MGYYNFIDTLLKLSHDQHIHYKIGDRFEMENALNIV